MDRCAVFYVRAIVKLYRQCLRAFNRIMVALNVLGIAIIREVSVRSFAANLGSTKADQYLRPLARYHHPHMDCYVSEKSLDDLPFLQ